MDTYAIIVAGGSGTRMGTVLPKQFLLLAGKPLFIHTVTAFLDAFDGLTVVLVLPQAYLQKSREMLQEWMITDRCLLTAGGETRFHSVKNGLQHVPDNAIVFVHDAVRCLVSRALILRCYSAACQLGNAVPAVAATDSLRMETAPGITQAIDRSKIKAIQTPQTFPSRVLKNAFAQHYNPAFTDEASVVESTGVHIHLVEGETTNLKITTPLDLIVAASILQSKA